MPEQRHHTLQVVALPDVSNVVRECLALSDVDKRVVADALALYLTWVQIELDRRGWYDAEVFRTVVFGLWPHIELPLTVIDRLGGSDAIFDLFWGSG